MKLILILLKFLIFIITKFLSQTLRLNTVKKIEDLQNSLILKEQSNNRKNFISYLINILFKVYSNYNLFVTSKVSSSSLKIMSTPVKHKDNIYLFRLLCFFLRVNINKDSEFLILKSLNLGTEHFDKNKKGQQAFEHLSSVTSQFSQRSDPTQVSSLENNSILKSTNQIFPNSQTFLSSNLISISQPMESAFVNNRKNSFDFLTSSSSNRINFNALKSLYDYLKMFDDVSKLTDLNDSAYPKKLVKIKKKDRIPKNFRGGSLEKTSLKNIYTSQHTKDGLKRDFNTLKQLEFLLKNRKLLEDRRMKIEDLELTNEVKKVMFSNYNTTGAYGPDSTLYSSDLYSKNRLVTVRRIHLSQNNSPIQDLSTFNQKVGFSNFNLSQNEEWENSADVPLGGWSTGQSYFINPFLVCGFVIYSFLELIILVYLMSFFFGNPYDTFVFFLKYPLVYFYDNLSFFPTANFFFSAIIFWFVIIFTFSVHLFELIDEERFDPPRLSWLFNLTKDFVYLFIMLWCAIFCIFELVFFFDLLISRVFFIGLPGYPNLFSILFLFFYDAFYILGSTDYFSFYLKSFVHLDIKFPSFYFSDYAPLVYRYPLVQPYFFGNPYLDRPNFFLWLSDSFLNFFSGESQKKMFFSMENRVVFQRELIQDIRKYNYIRKNLLNLKIIGQLHMRGWNGFNYRLDLQTFSQPIFPSEQMIYFDWRLKNTHSNGMYSRLLSQVSFGYDGNNNNLVKKIKLFRGRQLSSRYGYLRYLKEVLNEEMSNTSDWFVTRSDKKRKLFKRLSHLPEGIRKSKRRPKKPVNSFFFNSVNSKFSMLLKENKRINTKADRNFRFSHRFKKIWSFLPGNNMSRNYFRFKPFISVKNFLSSVDSNYSKNRSYLKTQNLVKVRNLPIGKYSLRNLTLTKPESLFPNNLIDDREDALKSKNFFKDWKNVKKINSLNHKKILGGSSHKSEILRSFSPFSLNQSNFISDQKVKSSKVNDLSLSSSDYFTKRRRNKLKLKNSFFARSPIYSRRLKNRRLDLSAIPNFPFRVTKKYKFVSKIFQNLPPHYFLKPTAIFTTFSKIQNFSSFNKITFVGSNFFIPLSINSGSTYTLSSLFLGFGKLLTYSSPIKLFSYDYYYSQNHNFIFSLLENYLKQNQFRTILTSSARFNHPLKGGFRHNLDFMYPMLSELRIKEKIFPIDFLYNSFSFKNYKYLRLDPYEAVRASRFSKSSCYFLDARIQNWLNFNNVIWNDYFHFFFNRSFKTEGNGVKFNLMSYNPIQGPASYKLFIDSPTLQTPRVGHYFYNYISWLQYKFKWLLYPTSTYKRFDSFRFNHQHANKKFYFTSLLKFYQLNLFRWQQSAQIFQWNQIQSKNFLLHLFFHKYKLLSQLKTLVYPRTLEHSSNLNFSSTLNSNNLSFIDSFNVNFFHINNINSENLHSSFTIPDNNLQLYIPSFNSLDFRFFQHATDLRRWKALQTSFIRDWKFEKYIRYLGPVLYRDDVSSLMGFFAPFEYRNQIITSRMRNDSLRFSIFFPKKVIDEQFSNFTKKLAFPPNKFRRKVSSKFFKHLSISKPMYYAYVINKPFLSNSSNYSFFSKKGKKIVYGLYPTLQRFNINSSLNLFSSDSNSTDDFSFNELNTKKKRLLKDKDFWFSRIYELQEVRDRISNNILNADSRKEPKIQKFRVLLDQLGKPLDMQIPTSLPRLQLSNYNNENLLNFVDLDFKKNVLDSSNDFNSMQKKAPALTVLPHLYPDIFMRFGGSKASSRRWHMGQSWLKFVVASQNVSVFPISDNRSQLYSPSQTRVKNFSDDIVSSSISSKGFSGNPYQNRYNMTPEIRDKHGYFNFGLSGMGRLPRLNRSFFHMLFFRNKLDDFRKLKRQFLKIYLMSLPLFHSTDFSSNSSFKIFWSFFTGLDSSKYDIFNFRYNLLFTSFNLYKLNFNFSSLIYHPSLGTLVSYYSPLAFLNNEVIILQDQYLTLKSFEKFKIFQNLNFDRLVSLNNHVNSSFLSFDNDKLFIFSSWRGIFNTFFNFFSRTINNLLINLSFKFFNCFFFNYQLLLSKNNTYLTFFVFDDIKPLYSAEFSVFSKFDHLIYFNKFVDYSSFYKTGFLSSDFDIYQSRLFYGSFRSKLHWYHFPMQYYMSLQYFLSSNFLSFLFDLFDLSLKLVIKNSSSVYLLFVNNPSINFFNVSKAIDFADFSIFNNSKYIIKLNSDFFSSFSLIYSNFYKLNSHSFVISITNRFTDLNFIKNLFSYNIIQPNSLNKFVTYNSFFFISDFFSSFSKLNTRTHFFYSQKTNLIDNVEFFSENLFNHTLSLDGSGRHNRPKASSQTLDKIFTYREYEKYRHEHHRQRFRGITPHWVQNTFKNRTNFRYFYRSSDKRKRVMTRVLLNRMFQYVKQSRSRFSPRRLNRISFYNHFNDVKFLKDLLTSDSLKYERVENSPVSFNSGKSFFYHDKFVNSTKFDKSYSSLKRKRVGFIDSLFNEYVTPVSTSLRRDDQFLKYKKFLKQYSHNDFTFSSFFEMHDIKDFEDGPKFPYWYGSKKRNDKDSSFPVFMKFNNVSKNLPNNLFKLNNSSNFRNFTPKSYKNLRLITESGFYRNGGNFINVKNFPDLNGFLTSPTSYSVKKKDGFFTGERYVRQASGAYDPKVDYPPMRQSIKQSMVEPYYRTSPRYLRTLRSRKHIAHFLNSNTIGGSHSRTVKNPYMNPNILISELKRKKRRKFKRRHLYKYPVNLKRFIRPFSKVIMSIPYLYSKWFTQNPRLSMSVDNEFLTIFSNNSYDEFNYICIQSLILLKRKIMFNIINLKLISHKHKILYFSNLKSESSNSELSNYSDFIYFWIKKFFFISHSFFFYFEIFFNYLNSRSVFLDLYKFRNWILSLFFQNEFFFVRLLYNPLISRFKHDSTVSSDLVFFEDFYYKQSSKRVLSQIAFSSHSLGGWNNPIGLSGQYIPGLNFYSKDSIHFNFNYQYPDFFSGRYFSPEILLDNNLVRQNLNMFDRNYLFNEFFVSPNYRKSWHFLSFRISSPVSPFIEYERPHHLIFQKNIKSKIYRLPLSSVRRVKNIYPNYLKSFFSTLNVENVNNIGHDVTLPLKMKFLNANLKFHDPSYRRFINNFSENLSLSPLIDSFSKSLKNKQLKVISAFHNRINLSPLVNKRRFGLRKQIWSPFRYNFYYKFNWKTFLHKYDSNDFLGFRHYKLNPYFDIYSGSIPRSFKLRAFQHLIISQIPRFEIDARRNIPLKISSKNFVLLFFSYFNNVNKNFEDNGYNLFGNKIFRYVNRKAFLFSPTHFMEGNRRNFFGFWNLYDRTVKTKSISSSKSSLFVNTKSKYNLKLPKYNSVGMVISDLKKKKTKVNLSFMKSSLSSNLKSIIRTKKQSSSFFYFFKIKRNLTNYSKVHFIKLNRFFMFQIKHFFNYLIGSNFVNLTQKKSFLRRFISSKFQNSTHYKSFYLQTTQLSEELSFFFILRKGRTILNPAYRSSLSIYLYRFYNKLPFFYFHSYFYNYSSLMRKYFLFPMFGRQSLQIPRLPSSHYYPNLTRHIAPFEYLQDITRPYFIISRIFSINTLYNLKKSRERSLNPQSWLSFDLFSRIRPSFRPFLHKFSKKFMLSRYIPSSGIPSYNTFIKMHTPRDSFFERHPYISFSIGLQSNNQLVSSESMYKEIRKRSNMLDFSRRHLKFLNPLNFSQDNAVFRKKRKKNLFYDFNKRRLKKYRFFNDKIFQFKDRNNRRARVYRGSFFFLRKMARHFLATKPYQFDINPQMNKFKAPIDLHFGTLFLKHFRYFDGLMVFNKKKHFLGTVPLRYRFNGLLKNANYYSYMTSPRRKRRFLNIFLIKPYNILLKFLRTDNYSFEGFNFLSNMLLKYGSLNLNNEQRLRSYYQPNLKVFFDFNAYKQRYNLGLLFRGLSFESDFQFFLFRKSKLTNFETSNESISSFLNFSVYDYFNLLNVKNDSQKGFVVYSKFSNLFFLFEKLFFKLNPIYLILLFIDFYLGLIYSLFYMMTQLYFFDLTFFVNFFNINDENFVYYLKKRPIFQLLFHLAFLTEYLKFSWLLSWKFLIFNFEYYPYYFIFFATLIIFRLISFNITRNKMYSPFIVPYTYRFSDFKLNPHSGWFDDAWGEIKFEALNRLNNLNSIDSFNLSQDYLLKFDDVKIMKRRYNLENEKRNFFQTDDENDDPAKRIDLSKYERASRTNVLFQKPLANFPLKRLVSKLWLPFFLIPSISHKNSDKMKLLDVDNNSKFNDQFDRSIFKFDINSSLTGDKDDNLNLKNRSVLSFFFLRQQLLLLFSGKISFLKFLNSLNLGSNRFSLDQANGSPHFINNYNIDDLNEEFNRLFLTQDSQLFYFSNQDLKKKRMFIDDENIHFYRKPGSILNSELLARKQGSENEQLYYVVEFPGRYNNTYVNAFSRLHAVRNINANSPYYGFFTFSKNAKLPTTFEEFLAFCSVDNLKNQNFFPGFSDNPQNLLLQPNLDRMRQLWTVFQYVTKYEYNMFNDFDFQDSQLFDVLSRLGQKNRYTIFDNLKFWFNKASVDATDLNYLNRRFFFNVPGLSNNEVKMYGRIEKDEEDRDDEFAGVPNEHLQTITPMYSILYIFYIYLIFFIFFLFLTFSFCFVFLFFFSFYNYVFSFL